jgi:murein L,D-transpeptidase YafK
MRKLQCISVALLLVSTLSCSSAKPASKQSGVDDDRIAKPESSSQNTAHLKLPLNNPSIVVKKSQRQLLLFSNGMRVRTYHIALGLSPIGDKVRQGDRRTPEGSFYIFAKNAKSAFYLSLGLSYPNAEHAARGLRDGLVTRSQYNQIMSALKRKLTPPQNTPLGGDIYIHGNGTQSDWTWGCVALENEKMRELYQAVQVRTPVVIEP